MLHINPYHLKGYEDSRREINNQPRPATPRRIAAARRALERERDAVPLFADQVAELQPTPEERVHIISQAASVRYNEGDARDNAKWDEAITTLAELPKDEQIRFAAYWNTTSGDGRRGGYDFASALHNFKAGRVSRAGFVDRSAIEDPDKRTRAEKLDRTLNNLRRFLTKASEPHMIEDFTSRIQAGELELEQLTRQDHESNRSLPQLA